MVELLQGLPEKEYDTLRKTLEKDIEELECKLNKIQVIVDLLDKKEQLANDIIEGISKIRHDDETIHSSRVDNIDDIEEPASWGID